MEDLFPLLIVIFAVIGSIASSAKKERERRAAQEHRRAASSVKSQPAQPPVLPTVQAAEVPAQNFAPTVHPHLEPDCETHDAPGSLGVTSMEGKDPCHEEQLTNSRTNSESSSAHSGMTFDWSGESMVKAFVMQEVLNRPVARRQTR